MLEEMMLQAQEREKAMEARMQEEIRKQVHIAMSAQRQASEPRMNDNISPPSQLKSSCASTELLNQDDTALRFPVDVPRGNDIIKVVVDVFTPLDPTKTPRIHGAPIQPGYARVTVDKVSKGYEDLALDIPGGDGQKTLGEAEKAYILWRKHYIIIPGASAPPPADIRCGQKLTKHFFNNFLWA
jgi:hypothetical protein